MKDVYISLAQITRLLRERSNLLIISAIIGIALYLYIVKFYGRSFGIFFYTNFPVEIPIINEKTDYSFYSGGRQGVYYKIGDILEKESLDNESTLFANIKNKSTSGGYENLLRVLGDSKGSSFGLVQEEVYKDDDMMQDEVNFITPLYMERLHILYSDKDSTNHKISNNTEVSTLRFLSQSRLDIGSPNSGTHIISRYIINHLNNQIRNYNLISSKEDHISQIKNITNNGINETYDKIKNNERVILFMISGAPNNKINNLLSESVDVKLLGIEPDFTASLKKAYDINLHFSSFINKYQNHSSVTTIGTFAWLITNKSTPPSDIKEVLETLASKKENFSVQLGLAEPNHKLLEVDSPLEEFDFLGHFNNKHEKARNSVLRNILLFLFSLIPSTIVFFHILSLLISTSKTDNYHDKIVEILNHNNPSNDLPSIFYFTKTLSRINESDLSDNEYEEIRLRTLYQIFDLKKDGKLNDALSKLRHREISKLVSLVIVPCLEDTKIDDNLLVSLSYSADKIAQTGLAQAVQDFKLAEEVERLTKGHFFKSNRRSKRLLIKLLNSEEILINLQTCIKEYNFNQGDEKLITPFIKKNQTSIINRIVKGISRLHQLKTRISQDYTDGYISEKHYNFLDSKLSDVMKRMQDTLTFRLSEIMNKGYTVGVEKETLRSYYVSNYISQKDYYYLLNRLKNNVEWTGNY